MNQRVYSGWAGLGFVLAVGAMGVALYATLLAPGWVQSNAIKFERLMGWLIWPGVVGLIAAWMGAHGMAEIEARSQEYCGDGLAVFAVMIGWLAVVTASLGVFVNLVWPILR